MQRFAAFFWISENWFFVKRDFAKFMGIRCGKIFLKLFLKKELIPCLVFLGLISGCNVREIPGETRNLEKLYEKQFQEINFFPYIALKDMPRKQN